MYIHIYIYIYICKYVNCNEKSLENEKVAKTRKLSCLKYF